MKDNDNISNWDTREVNIWCFSQSIFSASFYFLQPHNRGLKFKLDLIFYIFAQFAEIPDVEQKPEDQLQNLFLCVFFFFFFNQNLPKGQVSEDKQIVVTKKYKKK